MMRRLLSLQRLVGDNDGVTAIEYGLIAAPGWYQGFRETASV